MWISKMTNRYDSLAQAIDYYYDEPEKFGENETKKIIGTTLLIGSAWLAYASWANSTSNQSYWILDIISSSEDIEKSMKKGEVKKVVSTPVDYSKDKFKDTTNRVWSFVENLKTTFSIWHSTTLAQPQPLTKEKIKNYIDLDSDENKSNTPHDFWAKVPNLENTVVTSPKFWVKYTPWKGVAIDGKLFASLAPSLYKGNRVIIFDVRNLEKNNNYYKYIFWPGSAWYEENCTRYAGSRIWYNLNIRIWGWSQVASNLINNSQGQVERWKFFRIKMDELKKIQPGAIISTKWNWKTTFDHVKLVEYVDYENEIVYTSGMNEWDIYDYKTYKSATHSWKISLQKLTFSELRSERPIIAMPSVDAKLKWSSRTVLENFVESWKEYDLVNNSWSEIQVSVQTTPQQTSPQVSSSVSNPNVVTPNITQTQNTKKIFESQLPNLWNMSNRIFMEVKTLWYEPYDLKKDLLQTPRLNESLTWHVFILDSWHWGVDSGAVFDGSGEWKTVYLTEASTNWRDTVLMAKYLVARGAIVYFTQVLPVKFDENNINNFWNSENLKKLTNLATTADYNSSYYFGTDNTDIYKQLEINQRNETTFLAMKKHKFSPITFLSFHKDAFTQENRFSIEVEKYDPDSIKFANSVSEKIDWEWMSPRVSLRSWNKQWTFSIWVLRWPNEKNAGYNMREILIESANIWKDSSQLLSDSQTWAKINMIWDAIVSSLSQTSDSKVASIPALPQDYVRKNLSSEKYQQNQLLMGQKLLAFAKENFDPKEYEYGRPDRTIAANDPSRRGFDLDKDWKKWMDCSSFIFFTLEKFWYNLGENKPIDT